MLAERLYEKSFLFTLMTFETKSRHDIHLNRFQQHIGNARSMKDAIAASFSLYVLDWRSVFNPKPKYAYRLGSTTQVATYLASVLRAHAE